MSFADIISLLGGLAFFLFGMNLLGDGLKKVAGSRLETILARLTSNTFKGILLGTVVTAVIQSSSATTVMVVGFVNTGIMKLTNAIGIIMGANIGTTATSWLLTLAGVEGSGGFSSETMFALIAFVGIILFLVSKKTTQKNVGVIFLALAVLMSGMKAMSGAMDGLKDSEAFLTFISALSNPFLSMLIGFVVTAIVQSCSASIGILQALSATGVISYEVAVPMILGMCIGACVPVLISAIGANINAKRAAFIYLYFNLIGTAVLMIPFYIIHMTVGIDFMSTMATSLGIAVVNTVFKVASTILLAPFSKLLEKLAVKTIRQRKTDGDEEEEFEENLLDERFLAYPPLAVEQSAKTMERMCIAAFKNLSRSLELLQDFTQEKYDKIMLRENTVDRYEDRMGAYMVRIDTSKLNDKDTRTTAKFFRCITNVERISDLAVKLAEAAQEMHEKHIAFSQQGASELQKCIDAIREISTMTQDALIRNDLNVARRIEPLKVVIHTLTEEAKVHHIQRVQAGSCTLKIGFVFNDCIHSFERVADHCSNIAVAVLEAVNPEIRSHDYLRSIKIDNDEEYSRCLGEFEEKYFEAGK